MSWPHCTKLAATGSPKQVLRWLDRPEIEATLAGMAKGNIAVSHDSLDSLGRNHWVAHLRQVLVAGDVLPARDEVAAGLEDWLNTKLDAIPDPDDRKMVAAFATWWVLRRRRARAERRPVNSVAHPHQVINGAIQLLAWLGAHQRTLGSATQADIDLWIVSGPPARRQARDFLRWARRHHLCANLEIVRRPNRCRSQPRTSPNSPPSPDASSSTTPSH